MGGVKDADRRGSRGSRWTWGGMNSEAIRTASGSDRRHWPHQPAVE
jgi:hypothetical protein